MESKYFELLAHLRDGSFNLQGALDVVQHDLKYAQDSHQEQKANFLWAICTVIEIHMDFVLVYELLQQREFYKAWCKAEEVEINCNNLKRNFSDYFSLVKDIYKCIIQLQGLYPYKFFSSYVIRIKQERCSICNQIRSIRNDCGHRRGYVYNGKLCCNIVEDFEFKSIDIVDNPVHKYSVLFVTSKEGEQVDNYNYLLVESLMMHWDKPFQNWSYDIENTHKPLSEFPGLTNNDFCPCGSGKKYGDCCKSDSDGIKHRIYQFRIEKMP